LSQEAEIKSITAKSIEIKLIESVLEKRKEIIAKAKEEASRIIKTAEQECELIRTQRGRDSNYTDPTIQLLREQIIGETELEGRKLLMQAREDELSLVFQMAEQQLKQIAEQQGTNSNYKDVLIKLVIEGILAIGGNTFVVRANQRDIAFLINMQEEIVQKVKPVLGEVKIRFSTNSIATIGGAIIQNDDGTKIFHNTLESRLKTVQNRSKAVVAKVIGAL
jgi:vacuolar-type H+-ATPase subunit E/Vma4